MKTLAMRIEEVRIERGLSKSDIWKAAGLSSGAYSHWMNGGALRGENLIKVAQILGVDPTWLETGKGNMEAMTGRMKQAIQTVSGSMLSSGESDFCTISLLNAYGSMGEGAENGDADLPIDLIQVKKTWISENLKPLSAPSNLYFIHALGDSMTPTLSHGDIVLVDTGIKTADVDGVYVLRAMRRLFIKRVRQRFDGAYEISSDNPTIKTVDILNGDHEVEILGRVVWVWNGRKV